MRWRFRFRLRILMLLVAVVAVAMWTEMTRRRWVLLGKAAGYARWEQADLRGAEAWEHAAARDQREAEARKDFGAEPRDTAIQGSLNAADTATWFRQRAAEDARLKRMYQRAASHPWRPVEAD
jgi:hypothetical protein